MKPLAIDLFCGLGGWTEGLLEEGYYVVGFDIEQHVYGEHRYPAQLVIQDVLTLHGKQFKDAALIVASPPCQAYSYRAMPWKRAKALPPPDNSLFDACFRIQREASEAAGRYIPMVVENVKGAQKWVGRSRWNFGSFHLWGDVPALMPITINGRKSSGMNWSDSSKRGQDFTRVAGNQAIKNNGGSWFAVSHNNVPHSRGDGLKSIPHRPTGHWTNPAEHGSGLKSSGGDAFWVENTKGSHHGSHKRKFASALIAKIPAPLSRHIARTYFPSAKNSEQGDLT